MADFVGKREQRILLFKGLLIVKGCIRTLVNHEIKYLLTYNKTSIIERVHPWKSDEYAVCVVCKFNRQATVLLEDLFKTITFDG